MILLIVYVVGYLLTVRPLIRYLIEAIGSAGHVETEDVVFGVSVGVALAAIWPIAWPVILLLRLAEPYFEAYAERLNNE